MNRFSIALPGRRARSLRCGANNWQSFPQAKREVRPIPTLTFAGIAAHRQDVGREYEIGARGACEQPGTAKHFSCSQGGKNNSPAALRGRPDCWRFPAQVSGGYGRLPPASQRVNSPTLMRGSFPISTLSPVCGFAIALSGAPRYQQ